MVEQTMCKQLVKQLKHQKVNFKTLQRATSALQTSECKTGIMIKILAYAIL